jgi:hypothetical protein
LGNCRINVINNYYRPGPDATNRLPFATKFENRGALKVFLGGNVFEGRSAFDENNYAAVDFDRWTKGNYLRTTLEEVRVPTEFDVGAARPQTQPAAQAYVQVLKSAGASRRQDAADARIVNGVRDRRNRLIDSQDEVGGWPVLKSEPARVDKDGDGMPDDWERQNNFDPKNPDDRNGDFDADGFTNLEEYLNGL